MKTPLPAEVALKYVADNLRYEPETKQFIRTRTRGSKVAGTAAGTPHNSGHVAIKIAGKLILSHRLVWLVTHGAWPPAPAPAKSKNKAGGAR